MERVRVVSMKCVDCLTRGGGGGCKAFDSKGGLQWEQMLEFMWRRRREEPTEWTDNST